MDDPVHLLLQELEQFGKANDAQAGSRADKMLNVTPETGQLLALLVRATRARRTLELGTSNGYSTLWLADAARALCGTVVSVEVSPAKAEMARHNLERAGLSPWVRLQVADAGPFLRQQPPASFDLVFLDADRSQAAGWWPDLQRVLAPGGLLVADNAVSHPAELEGLLAGVRSTAGWLSVVVPVGKGELVALKPLA